MTSPFADTAWPGDALAGPDGTSDTLVPSLDTDRSGFALPAVDLPPIPLLELPSPEQIMERIVVQPAGEDLRRGHIPMTPDQRPLPPPPPPPPPFGAPWTAGAAVHAPLRTVTPHPVATSRPAGPSRPAARTTRRPGTASSISTRPHRKSSGAGWSILLVFVIFLIASGLGRELLDAVMAIVGQ